MVRCDRPTYGSPPSPDLKQNVTLKKLDFE